MEAAFANSDPIHVWAARGGHGATTVAGALGVMLGVPVGSHDQEALEWIWTRPSVAVPSRGATVRDSGVITRGLPATQTNVVVLRGPCSLAIRKLALLSDPIDHLILFREPWRPLRRQDAEDALGTGVDAEIQFSPRVARLADAGLLGERVIGLPEFAELTVWAEDGLAADGPNLAASNYAARRSADTSGSRPRELVDDLEDPGHVG